MPTITFSLSDLNSLVGAKLSIEDVERYCEFGKGEFEGYDKSTDEITIDFGDTNLPYLWSVEGVARLIKGIIGKQKGIPPIEIKNGNYLVKVDKSVDAVRPYIAGFVAKGCKINDYLIKQMVQLQEKLCESYGRRRLKVAIGVYSYEKIKFPVHYKAVKPESVSFTPLEFKTPMTMAEILENHPKGKEYSWILNDAKKHPLLVDDAGEVLSYPPIINSDLTGRVSEGDEHLFVEATGMALEPLLLAMNIMAYAFYDRGFEIYSVTFDYSGKKVVTPLINPEKISIEHSDIFKILGIDLKKSEIRELLGKGQYDARDLTVTIPPYRSDILHPVDIIEDIGIQYGYDEMDSTPLSSYTIGSTSEFITFRDKVRTLLVGMGYQEIFSPILSNKKIMEEGMNCKKTGLLSISNYMSETFSSIRSWILPLLVGVISKNKHIEYPQRIFEEGIVSVNKDGPVDYSRIGVLTAHEDADYTEIRQILDSLMDRFGFEYSVEDTDHDSFIPGRVGRVVVNNKKVAYIGELNPDVLHKHGIEVPMAGLELNLTELFENKKN